MTMKQSINVISFSFLFTSLEFYYLFIGKSAKSVVHSIYLVVTFKTDSLCLVNLD